MSPVNEIRVKLMYVVYIVNGRGEEGSDGCGLEGSKEWMEEGGTEAP